ncbi:MAG: hypothetical protein EOP33_05325 [Rickettsiaceae bacterium]|nr:MAG: hypothetical protein EOP33_05325 [Rickettsiaceae bacterium]
MKLVNFFTILVLCIFVENFSSVASDHYIDLPYNIEKQFVQYSEFDQLQDRNINFTCYIYCPFQAKKDIQLEQKSSFSFSSFLSNLKTTPILIVIPALGESTSSYNKLCSLLALHGYCVIGFDLTEFSKADIPQQDYDNEIKNHSFTFPDNIKSILPDIEKAQAKIVEITTHLSSKQKIKALIGIKTGAPIASKASYLKNISLISILDPTGVIISAEGSISNFVLFFNDISDVSSKNNQNYNNWIQGMNNQEGLIQVERKPFYKEWVSQNHLSFSINLRDDGLVNNFVNEQGLNTLVNQSIDWLQKH